MDMLSIDCHVTNRALCQRDGIEWNEAHLTFVLPFELFRTLPGIIIDN